MGCHFLLQCMKVKSESKVAQTCPTLSDPMDCSLPGSSIHGIFQASVLEWTAIALSIYMHTYIYMCIYIHICVCIYIYVYQFISVTHSCPTLCDPMNHSTPGLPVHHQLPESTQTHVHQVGDAIQPSLPLLSPSPPAPNPSQHQSLFQ